MGEFRQYYDYLLSALVVFFAVRVFIRKELPYGIRGGRTLGKLTGPKAQVAALAIAGTALYLIHTD